MENSIMSEAAKANLFHVLNLVPTEVDGLKKALIENKVDGSMYSGPGGACLVGTLCKTKAEIVQDRWLRSVDSEDEDVQGIQVITPLGKFVAHVDNPIERFVMLITPHRIGQGEQEALAARSALLFAIVEWEVLHKAKAMARLKKVLGRKKPTLKIGAKLAARPQY